LSVFPAFLIAAVVAAAWPPPHDPGRAARDAAAASVAGRPRDAKIARDSLDADFSHV
jgi:hypothetical protein